MTAAITHQNERNLRTRRSLGLWQWLSVGVAVLVVVPIAALLLTAVGSSGENWKHIASPVMLISLQETVILLVGVGLLVAAIGTGAAWLVTAYTFPGRRVVEWALLLPLAVPTYIVAYCYLDIWHPVGPVQTALRWLIGADRPQDLRLPDIRSLPGCILLFGFVLFPYVYVPVRAMFAMQSANMLEAARTLGVSRRALFWRVALPLARPAIAVGTSLALMEALNDVGASEFLGLRTLTVSIYSTWINKSDLPAAAQIALAMLVVVWLLLTLERWARRNQRFSNSAQRSNMLQPHSLSGARGIGALLLCSLPVIAGFAAPLFYLGSASFRRIGTAGISDQLLREGWNTLLLAATATSVIMIMGVIVAYCIRVRPGKIAKNALRVAAIGYALPGTVVAVGVLIPVAMIDRNVDSLARSLFGISTGLLLIGSGAALVYAYAIRFLAISSGTIESGLARIPRSLDHAARSLGDSAAGTFKSILLPLTKPAIAAAALLVFVDCVKELPVTLLLRPLNLETFATHLYAEAARGTYEEGAIAALAIVIIGIFPLIVVSRLGYRNSSGRPD